MKPNAVNNFSVSNVFWWPSEVLHQWDYPLTYLRQCCVQLPLQRVPLVADVVQLALGQAQVLLRLSQSVQEPISFLQHGHHQRLKVTLGIGVQRGARTPPAGAVPPVGPFGLADGRHHLTHHLQAQRRWGSSSEQRWTSSLGPGGIHLIPKWFYTSVTEHMWQVLLAEAENQWI